VSTLQRASLGNIAYVGSSAGSIYTNPSSTSTLVVGLTLHNTNTTAETVNVYAVPNSSGSLGTAATSNRVLSVALAPNDTLIFEFPYGHMMTGTNDSIQASTTTASKVTVLVHGDKLA